VDAVLHKDAIPRLPRGLDVGFAEGQLVPSAVGVADQLAETADEQRLKRPKAALIRLPLGCPGSAVYHLHPRREIQRPLPGCCGSPAAFVASAVAARGSGCTTSRV
jgi:hypothetical protein